MISLSSSKEMGALDSVLTAPVVEPPPPLVEPPCHRMDSSGGLAGFIRAFGRRERERGLLLLLFELVVKLEVEVFWFRRDETITKISSFSRSLVFSVIGTKKKALECSAPCA